jgi:hypothetical protein
MVYIRCQNLNLSEVTSDMISREVYQRPFGLPTTVLIVIGCQGIGLLTHSKNDYNVFMNTAVPILTISETIPPIAYFDK